MAITFLKSIPARLLKIFQHPDPAGRTPSKIKSFRENQEKEAAFDSVHRGIKQIPVSQIVGSVGRYNDFDNQFRLKPHMPHDRLDRIKQRMKDGKSLPPVKLYQIKHEYYVLDGNHRVAAAKELGRFDIDSRIIELLPTSDTKENVIYREKVSFMDQTGIESAIEFTEMGQYHYLLEQIKKHRKFLGRETGQPMTLKHAADDWLKTIYRPLKTIIKNGNLIQSFPNRTQADLYVYISFHLWEKGAARKYGIGVADLIPKNMEDFRKKMADKKEREYPEMQREISAFILINVITGKETRIIDKLFALEEVQELHSIHGNVDIIIKIVLKRDLLSSDSEIIAQFVDSQIRRISGIASTQTLIPGISKIKNRNS